MARGLISEKSLQEPAKPKAKAKPSVEPKVIAGAAVGVVLVLVLAWVWWPSGAPKIDPKVQQALEAQKNDPAANPPQPDVPISNDGSSRRKAVKR